MIGLAAESKGSAGWIAGDAHLAIARDFVAAD
jgi:hypothetical protein